MKEHEIVSAVQQSTGIDDQHSAERAVRATLKVLGDRLAGGEPRDLAAQLPPALAEVLPAEGAGERFEVDEFYPRVAEQEGAEVGVARQHARAVRRRAQAGISDGELRDLHSQLPDSYADLFGPRARCTERAERWNAMPIKQGRDKNGPYYQWGDSGKKYYYAAGDKDARERAKQRAGKQGQAAHARGYGR